MSDASGDAICALCGDELLPCLELCFDCDLAAQSPAPRRRQLRHYSIAGVTDDRAPLLSTLALLCPTLSAEDATWLVQRGGFALTGEVTAEEHARLLSLLQTGAREVVSRELAPPPATGLRISLSRPNAGKLAAAAAIGGTALALGTPVMLLAALAMTGVVVSRMPHAVDRVVPIQPAELDAFLSPLPEDVVVSARVARTNVHSPAVLNMLRRSLADTAQIADAWRRSGFHLLRDDVRSVDDKLARFAKALFKVAVAADRFAMPSDRRRGGDYRQAGNAPDAAETELQKAATELASLRAAVTRSKPADLRREVVAALLTRLEQMTTSSVAALAHSELPLPRR